MRRIAMAAAALVLAVGAGCGEEDRSGPQKLSLEITNLLPLTGNLDQFGKAGRRASDVALEEIRQASAKAGGQHTVTMRNIDYKSLPVDAVRLANEAAEQGTGCVTGPWASGQAARVGAFASTPKRMLQISPSASAAQLADVDDRGYLNQVVPLDELQATALAELVSRRLKGASGKTVNIGAVDATYGKVLTKAFEEAWRAKQGTIGSKVTYRTDQTSLAPQADQLAAGDPDAWVFFDFADIYVRIGQELLADQKAGWRPRKTFGTDSLANARLPNIGPSVSNGLSGVAISAPQTGKAAESFDSAFKRVPGTSRQTFDAQQFDAVVLCYLSAVAAGSTKGSDMKDELRAVSAPPGRKYTWLELTAAIKALEQGQDIDYEGVSGPINLNADGSATAGVYDVYEYKDGALEVTDQIAVPLGSGGV